MEYVTRLLECTNRCLIPKLSKNYDEVANHPEFDYRNNNLARNFESLVRCLADLIIGDIKEPSTIISSLYILYMELKCDCLWNNEKSKDYSKKLNSYFELIADYPLNNVLFKGSIYDVQEIFDKCLDTMLIKLSSQDFKKYPGQIEVFCLILADLMKYDVVVKPQNVFPVILLLMDDYIDINKKNGLLCCLAALQCMKPSDFDGGNYYEVLYRSLSRTFFEKDLKITALTHACFIKVCYVYPPELKHEKLDELYTVTVHEIKRESNVYRKAECLKFTKSLIQTHKVNCVSESSFKPIICDCLDMCTNEEIANIFLKHTLECLEEWITHCWCIWKLSSDYEIISCLLKILYTCKKEDVSKSQSVQRIIVILISVSSAPEQQKILENLEKADCIKDDIFKERVEEIKKKFKT